MKNQKSTEDGEDQPEVALGVGIDVVLRFIQKQMEEVMIFHILTPCTLGCPQLSGESWVPEGPFLSGFPGRPEIGSLHVPIPIKTHHSL